jgi:hypothetical protein
MTYQGSCHCGAVAYEVEGEIQGAIMCNCSICHRKGGPLWFVPRANLRFKQGEDKLKAYTFNKHHINHLFCPTCGIHTHGAADDPKGNAMAAINLRCLEGVELESLQITPYDGRSK